MSNRILIISQSAIRHGVKVPQNALLRVNLAWCSTLDQLKRILRKYRGYKIFLDIPRGRMKPPNYGHDYKGIAEVINGFKNIKYIAVSNVETIREVNQFQKLFKGRKIVPKIETWVGAMDVEDIIGAMNYKPKVIMLDHQDLFSDLVANGKENLYLNIVTFLAEMCKRKKVILLRTVGVVFAAWRSK